MNIFQYNSYKDCLRDFIVQKKAEKGFQNKLSKAAGCQSSHLSQVLHREAQLTMDQAYGLIKSMDFSEEEVGFFLLLVQYERAVTPKLKEFLKVQVSEMKAAQLRLSKKIKATKFSPKELGEHQGKYYSHWAYIAIHIAGFLEENKSVEDFSKALGLKREFTAKVLFDLKKMHLVDNDSEGGEWSSLENNLSLNDNERNIRNHHLNWRLKAIDNIPNYEASRDLHYSGVFALSKEDIEQLKLKLNSWIVEARETALASNPEDMVNLNIDFYKV